MKLKPYPEYKKSGFERANTIPINWEKVRLGTIFKFSKGFGLSKSSLEEQGEFDCVLYGELFTRYKDKLVLNELSSRTNEDEGCISFGDEILIPASTTTVGEDLACAKVLSVTKARIGGDVIILRPKSDKVDRAFYCYFIEVVNRCDFARNSKGVTIVHIYADGLKNMTAFLPPYVEQQLISKFLDRETGKLDNLISKQEYLIELLQEKRQAIISHAVTKGLNPDAKMKDSGVEWLGMVPEKWEALTIRRISRYVTTGGTPSEVFASDDIENGFTWYTPGDFGSDLILTKSSRKTTQNAVDISDAKLFPAESVLIVSIGATLGKVGYSEKPSSANQQINAVIPNSKINGYFLAYSLSVKLDAMKFVSNSSTIGIMNQEKTKEIWIAVPPFLEQISITNYLDEQTAKIDTLIEKATRSIELAKEHRTALISAAVTGKIDVRGLTQ